MNHEPRHLMEEWCVDTFDRFLPWHSRPVSTFYIACAAQQISVDNVGEALCTVTAERFQKMEWQFIGS
jgi:hypothetical protein